MIIRNKRQSSSKAEEITFNLAFTVGDVRAWLEGFYSRAGLIPFSEEDLAYFFVHSHLKEFQEKHAKWIAEWAVSLAKRHEFITPSSTTDGEFYISVRHVLPRQGRKPAWL